MCAAVHISEPVQGLTIPQALAAMESVPCLMLLHSAARHRERDSRYSFLTGDPVALTRIDRVEPGDTPFKTLRLWQSWLRECTEQLPEANQPPFCGGIAGLLSYELGHAFERLPRASSGGWQIPVLLAGLFDWAIVWDHLAEQVRVLTLDLRSVTSAPASADRVKWIRQKLAGLIVDPLCQVRDAREHQQPAGEQSVGGHLIEPQTQVCSNFSRPAYVAAVERVIEYIRAGDIFQANLSQQLSTRWSGTAPELLLRIRERNPAPFCGLLQAPDFAVVSASPERFLKVDAGGRVETRPIKGTRRRQRSPVADLFAASELSASEKDRAENVMIVDLLRNDLSRSCLAGSVRVTGLCELEKFETVLHLVSTIEGQLRPDCDVWDLLSGSFPGGSITGAPKIRAMEIISELEQVPRGAYCGSLFAMGPAGDFDSSILIRTMTLRDGVVTFPVGGGIVADSNPLDEYRETLHKASGLIRCLLK